MIITDEILDDHRYVLPEIKLGDKNVRIRLIEVRRWQDDFGTVASINVVNNQEPIGQPSRPSISKSGLLSRIPDKALQEFAFRLDKLLTQYSYLIRQRSKSRLAYTTGTFNRLFVFVCANPVFGDKVGDFIVTTECSAIGLPDEIWGKSSILASGRKDDWGGDVYELASGSERQREEFLQFFESVLKLIDRQL